MDAKGELAPMQVQTGITDGSLTEISGANVKEGMKVIAGTLQQTAQTTTASPFNNANAQQQQNRRPGGF